MPENQDFQRRLPSVFRNISDIRPEDIRVCIIGRVIDSQGSTAVVDDGTGNVSVSLQKPGAKIGSTVRVFGRVIHMENGFELQGEILQEAGDVDVGLYRKIEGKWAGDSGI